MVANPLERSWDWEVGPCLDGLGNVRCWDINIRPQLGHRGVAVIASVYSGEEVARAILAACQATTEHPLAAMTRLNEELGLYDDDDAQGACPIGEAMTSQNLMERHRERKFTPGPWSFDGPNDNIIIWSSPDDRVCFLTSNGPTEANAALIADAPAMLDHIETLTKRVGELEAMLTDIRAAHLHSTSDTDGMDRIEEILDRAALNTVREEEK